MKNRIGIVSLFLLLSILINACGTAADQPVSQEPAPLELTANAVTPIQVPTSTMAPALGPVPTAAPECIALDESLPAVLKEKLASTLADKLCEAGFKGRQTFEAVKKEGLVNQVFALVAPFETVRDSLSLDELKALWSGTALEDFDTILVTDDLRSQLEASFGKASSATVRNASSEEKKEGSEIIRLAERSLAILPFEQIMPAYKVLALDEQSPIRKGFKMEEYPLKFSYGFSQPENAPVELLEKLSSLSNYDPNFLTVVNLTGTTALVRATADAMEKEGFDKPAAIIGPTLADADITHISNEVSFAEDCPDPNPVSQSMKFCSKDSYNKVLEMSGVDVVDLTGDHVVDWGAENLVRTVEIYNKLGWKHFGGGSSLADAQKPALFEHNGNKIAFVGCNAKRLGYNIATADTAGTLNCDMAFVEKQIKDLKAQGYLVIMTFQHNEYYSWYPDARMVQEFEQAAEFGADIVSGSQAHRPQTYEFWGKDQEKFIHYGLGNLYFDQILLGNDCDKGFIDRHVFYKGKYISTELLTIKFPNFLQPIWMAPAERNLFLTQLFNSHRILSSEIAPVQ